MVNLQPEITRKQGSAVIFVVLFLLVGAPLLFRTPTGMEGVRVAIYSDSGVLANSATALESMFRWINADVNYVNSTEIRSRGQSLPLFSTSRVRGEQLERRN